MISKLGPQIVCSRLVVIAELPPGTADRFVELTEAVLGLDDVEVLPVSLREGKGLRRPAPLAPGLDGLLLSLLSLLQL